MTSNEDSCCLKNGQQLEQASEQAYVVLAKNFLLEHLLNSLLFFGCVFHFRVLY